MKDEKIIKEAQKFYQSQKDAHEYEHELGLECAYCVGGKQWTPADEQARGNRPVITVNKLSKPTDYAANRHYENLSSIKYNAWEKDDVDTMEVVNGLVRHIENSNISNAKVAYRTAYFNTLVYGFGFWRINTRCLDEKSMDQEIVIEEIEDPLSVYLDEDKCIITEKIAKDDFIARYPNANCESWDTDNTFVLGDKEIIIAEYWVRTKTAIKIFQIERVKKQDEQIVSISQLNMSQNEQLDTEIVVITEEELKGMPDGTYRILNSRESESISVKQYLVSPSEVLKTVDWYGKHIPIVEIGGQQYISRDKKKFRKGLSHDAISPQKLLNYYKSQEAERLQKAIKNVPVGAEGQFDDYEDDWANPEQSQKGYLEYKPASIDGKPIGPPTPYPGPQDLSGYSQNAQIYDEDIKSTTGVYNPTLGFNPRGESGRALLAQQNVTNLGLAHFDINFQVGQRKTGLILIDLIPYIYDTVRQIKILGDDMKEKVVTVNQKYLDESGNEKFYNLKKAINCDVVIQTSYSAGTRRQEIVETLLDFAKTVPHSQQVIGDMVASNLDMEKSEELARRMRALIPPDLFQRMDQMKAEESGEVSPEQVQIQKMSTIIQKLQGELIKVTEDAKRFYRENERLKKKENAIKLDVEKIRQRGDIAEERIRSDGNLRQESMKQEGANYRELVKQRK